jgi:chromosome segregation ATPase
LAAPLVEETRRTFQREFEEKEGALEKRRQAFSDEQKAAEKARKDLDKERAALATQKEQIDERVAELVEEQPCRRAAAWDAAHESKPASEGFRRNTHDSQRLINWLVVAVERAMRGPSASAHHTAGRPSPHSSGGGNEFRLW